MTRVVKVELLPPPCSMWRISAVSSTFASVAVYLFIRAEHHQKIFRRGKGGVRPVNDHAVHIFIVVVGMVSVNGQQREFGDQLDALPEGIADAGVDGGPAGRWRRGFYVASAHGFVPHFLGFLP